MTRSLVRLAILVLLPAGLVSCAAGTLVPERDSMPAARASLLPEYRIFYDSLIDYGDWVLIEPYGYVFRPRVNFVAWQPYQDGFWAPTDVYGWTWISSEPFGWATYHYGNWLYDRYEGWVWIPGTDWGPAWVTWSASDDYVGWAPLPPRGVPYSSIPSNAFRFVPVTQLGSTDLSSKMVGRAQLAAKLAGLKPADDVVPIQGVRINRGPSIEWVEQKAGPLTRVAVQDLVPPADVASVREREAAEHPVAGGQKRAGGLAELRPAARRVATPDSTRRAAEAAAREVRSFKDRGFVGSRVPVVRPFGVPDRRGEPSAITPSPPRGKAARDTTRAK